mgnify:CR=1 FL=1
MPKRTDIQSIMIIGAGPIVIGQACEFDYSGVQGVRALREEAVFNPGHSVALGAREIARLADARESAAGKGDD